MLFSSFLHLCSENRRQINSQLKAGKQKAFATACGMAVMIFCMFSMYSLALWYGAKLITGYEPLRPHNRH